jgi:nucleoside-diphosphate-sugar epimerase
MRGGQKVIEHFHSVAEMNILITGATGLVGSALMERLRGNGNILVCQSRELYPDEPGIQWIRHDLLTDSWECLAPFRIDVVYHLAGQTGTYSAKNDPVADLTANVLGLLRLLEYFRVIGRRPFVVLAGTATEVGLSDQLPIEESQTDRPITFYDLSKLTAEMYLKQYVRDGLANGCTLRLSNVFGRRRMGQHRDRGVLDKIFARALSGQIISIYGDGNYLRDYIFIDDVVSAFVLAPEYSQETNGRAFYIGSGQGVALKDAFLKVATLAGKASGFGARIEHIAPPAALSDIEFRNAVIDPTAYGKLTGWTPKYDFDTGIEAAYRGYLRDI